MWPFTRGRKIASDHIDAWLAAESCPRRFLTHPDPAVRGYWIDRFGEIRRMIFARHLRTLTREERKQLLSGEHPSQSWERSADAMPYAEKLQAFLRQRGYDAEVAIGGYHCNRLVLSADLPTPLPEAELWTLPAYFHGFEIKYGYPLENSNSE